MKSARTIVAVTGHDNPRRDLMDRALLLGKETGATVILFDREADLGPLMSALPTAWSAEGDVEEFGDRLDPEHLEASGQAALAEQVRGFRAASVQAFGWLPPKTDATSLAEYASKQRADTILVSAEDKELVDGLQSLPDPPAHIEIVPAGR